LTFVFISFVLTTPTSRTSTGDRVEPFSSHKGEGLLLGTEEESAKLFPIPTIRFCSFHFFFSFPAIGVQPVFRVKEETEASIGVPRVTPHSMQGRRRLRENISRNGTLVPEGKPTPHRKIVERSPRAPWAPNRESDPRSECGSRRRK